MYNARQIRKSKTKIDSILNATWKWKSFNSMSYNSKKEATRNKNYNDT